MIYLKHRINKYQYSTRRNIILLKKREEVKIAKALLNSKEGKLTGDLYSKFDQKRNWDKSYVGSLWRLLQR